MDEHRFFYVMPYHDGDHLGIVTRQLHGQSDGRGLSGARLLRRCHRLRRRPARNARSAYHRGGLWHKDVKPENVIMQGRSRTPRRPRPRDAAPLGHDAHHARHRVLPRSGDGAAGAARREGAPGGRREVRHLRCGRRDLLPDREHVPAAWCAEPLHAEEPGLAPLDRPPLDGRLQPPLREHGRVARRPALRRDVRGLLRGQAGRPALDDRSPSGRLRSRAGTRSRVGRRGRLADAASDSGPTRRGGGLRWRSRPGARS